MPNTSTCKICRLHIISSLTFTVTLTRLLQVLTDYLTQYPQDVNITPTWYADDMSLEITGTTEDGEPINYFYVFYNDNQFPLQFMAFQNILHDVLSRSRKYY